MLILDTIRCICGFEDDDGATIACDRCGVWQHMICVNVQADAVPDVYLCDLCNPRNLDVGAAVAHQLSNRERDKGEFGRVKELSRGRKKRRIKTGAKIQIKNFRDDQIPDLSRHKSLHKRKKIRNNLGDNSNNDSDGINFQQPHASFNDSDVSPRSLLPFMDFVNKPSGKLADQRDNHSPVTSSTHECSGDFFESQYMIYSKLWVHTSTTKIGNDYDSEIVSRLYESWSKQADKVENNACSNPESKENTVLAFDNSKPIFMTPDKIPIRSSNVSVEPVKTGNPKIQRFGLFAISNIEPGSVIAIIKGALLSGRSFSKSPDTNGRDESGMKWRDSAFLAPFVFLHPSTCHSEDTSEWLVVDSREHGDRGGRFVRYSCKGSNILPGKKGNPNSMLATIVITEHSDNPPQARDCHGILLGIISASNISASEEIVISPNNGNSLLGFPCSCIDLENCALDKYMKAQVCTKIEAAESKCAQAGDVKLSCESTQSPFNFITINAPSGGHSVEIVGVNHVNSYGLSKYTPDYLVQSNNQYNYLDNCDDSSTSSTSTPPPACSLLDVTFPDEGRCASNAEDKCGTHDKSNAVSINSTTAPKDLYPDTVGTQHADESSSRTPAQSSTDDENTVNHSSPAADPAPKSREERLIMEKIRLYNLIEKKEDKKKRRAAKNKSRTGIIEHTAAKESHENDGPKIQSPSAVTDTNTQASAEHHSIDLKDREASHNDSIGVKVEISPLQTPPSEQRTRLDQNFESDTPAPELRNGLPEILPSLEPTNTQNMGNVPDEGYNNAGQGRGRAESSTDLETNRLNFKTDNLALQNEYAGAESNATTENLTNEANQDNASLESMPLASYNTNNQSELLSGAQEDEVAQHPSREGPPSPHSPDANEKEGNDSKKKRRSEHEAKRRYKCSNFLDARAPEPPADPTSGKCSVQKSSSIELVNTSVAPESLNIVTSANGGNPTQSSTQPSEENRTARVVIKGGRKAWIVRKYHEMLERYPELLSKPAPSLSPRPLNGVVKGRKLNKASFSDAGFSSSGDKRTIHEDESSRVSVRHKKQKVVKEKAKDNFKYLMDKVSHKPLIPSHKDSINRAEAIFSDIEPEISDLPLSNAEKSDQGRTLEVGAPLGYSPSAPNPKDIADTVSHLPAADSPLPQALPEQELLSSPEKGEGRPPASNRVRNLSNENNSNVRRVSLKDLKTKRSILLQQIPAGIADGDRQLSDSSFYPKDPASESDTAELGNETKNSDMQQDARGDNDSRNWHGSNAGAEYNDNSAFVKNLISYLGTSDANNESYPPENNNPSELGPRNINDQATITCSSRSKKEALFGSLSFTKNPKSSTNKKQSQSRVNSSHDTGGNDWELPAFKSGSKDPVRGEEGYGAGWTAMGGSDARERSVSGQLSSRLGAQNLSIDSSRKSPNNYSGNSPGKDSDGSKLKSYNRCYAFSSPPEPGELMHSTLTRKPERAKKSARARRRSRNKARVQGGNSLLYPDIKNPRSASPLPKTESHKSSDITSPEAGQPTNYGSQKSKSKFYKKNYSRYSSNDDRRDAVSFSDYGPTEASRSDHRCGDLLRSDTKRDETQRSGYKSVSAPRSSYKQDEFSRSEHKREDALRFDHGRGETSKMDYEHDDTSGKSGYKLSSLSWTDTEPPHWDTAPSRSFSAASHHGNVPTNDPDIYHDSRSGHGQYQSKQRDDMHFHDYFKKPSSGKHSVSGAAGGSPAFSQSSDPAAYKMKSYIHDVGDDANGRSSKQFTSSSSDARISKGSPIDANSGCDQPLKSFSGDTNPSSRSSKPEESSSNISSHYKNDMLKQQHKDYYKDPHPPFSSFDRSQQHSSSYSHIADRSVSLKDYKSSSDIHKSSSRSSSNTYGNFDHDRIHHSGSSRWSDMKYDDKCSESQDGDRARNREQDRLDDDRPSEVEKVRDKDGDVFRYRDRSRGRGEDTRIKDREKDRDKDRDSLRFRDRDRLWDRDRDR